MAKHTFTATHGVTFQDENGEVWAQFVEDRALAKPDGSRTYVFSTDDAAIAKRVGAVNEYAIAPLS